jgi:hypothetical protein
MHPLRKAVGVIVGLVVLVLLTFMFGKQTQMAPDNAGVVIDTERHSYASIPCVIQGDLAREVVTNRRTSITRVPKSVIFGSQPIGTASS